MEEREREYMARDGDGWPERTADAVNVVLGVHRDVVVEDAVNVRNVKPA